MALVYTSGRMEINMKECGVIHLSMAKVVKRLEWVINIQEHMLMVNLMASALTNGRMGLFM
jgi:hypothetical protein